ncbi:MAG: pseudouridine synthase [Methylophilaceae bacterium]|nr:pseudouridine synthase [Methylophilaceae bacterium]
MSSPRRAVGDARSQGTPSSPQRLQKVLALSGLGSRRDMEALIESGRVTVNGQPARLGMSVKAGDVVRIDKRIVRLHMEPRLPRVLIYHKLEGEIVSQDDPQQRPTVFEKLPHIRGAKWISVGRLDINSSGLMIFTTSGELANRFMHPRYAVEREYAVRVMGTLSEAQLRQLTEGIELEDGRAAFDAIQDRGGEGINHWYQVILREGRNREVRRMFEAVGLTVSRLMRVRFGPISLPPRLKRGQMMALDDEQVRELLVWAGLPVPHGILRRKMSERERKQVGQPFTPRPKSALTKATRPKRSAR